MLRFPEKSVGIIPYRVNPRETKKAKITKIFSFKSKRFQALLNDSLSESSFSKNVNLQFQLISFLDGSFGTLYPSPQVL